MHKTVNLFNSQGYHDSELTPSSLEGINARNLLIIISNAR